MILGRPVPRLRPMSRRCRVLVVAPLGSAHHRTISDAISAADPGTRVIVRPGTYREAVIIGKPVELLADQTGGDVVIEAADGDCNTVQTDHAVVRGFTLRSRAATKSKKHYGVNITQGFLLLEDCDVTSDSLACVVIHGAGTSPHIRKCRIHDGAQTGLLAYRKAGGLVEDCDIWGNGYSGVEISHGADRSSATAPSGRAAKPESMSTAAAWARWSGAMSGATSDRVCSSTPAVISRSAAAASTTDSGRVSSPSTRAAGPSRTATYGPTPCPVSRSASAAI